MKLACVSDEVRQLHFLTKIKVRERLRVFSENPAEDRKIENNSG